MEEPKKKKIRNKRRVYSPNTRNSNNLDRRIKEMISDLHLYDQMSKVRKVNAKDEPEYRRKFSYLCHVLRDNLASNKGLIKYNSTCGIYVNEVSWEDFCNVKSAWAFIADLIDMELVFNTKPVEGSWWQKLFFRSKEVANHPEVVEKFNQLMLGLKAEFLDKNLANVDKTYAEAAAILLNATKDISEIATNLNSIILIKYVDNGEQRLILKTLTTRQIMALNQNPQLLASPMSLLKKLEDKEFQIYNGSKEDKMLGM